MLLCNKSLGHHFNRQNMKVLPQKYIINISTIFHSPCHRGTNHIVSCSRLLTALVLPLFHSAYGNENNTLIYLPDYQAPRHNALQLLDIHLGTTYRFLAIAWHVLPNPASVLLCHLPSYISPLLRYIPGSLVVYSILNTCQLHHCHKAFASAFLSWFSPIIAYISGLFLSFILPREAFLTTPFKMPPIPLKTLYPITFVVYS